MKGFFFLKRLAVQLKGIDFEGKVTARGYCKKEVSDDTKDESRGVEGYR